MKLFRLLAILSILLNMGMNAEFLPASYINGLTQRYPKFAQQIEKINTELNLHWLSRTDENKNETAQSIIVKINQLKDIVCNAARNEVDETILELAEWQFISE